MKLMVIINSSLTVACFIHLGNILYNFLNPQQPSIKHYEKKLQDMEFPIIIKLCIESKDERSHELYENLGYEDITEFYWGLSRYNSSIFGWNGHTINGTTLGSTEGLNHYIMSNSLCF